MCLSLSLPLSISLSLSVFLLPFVQKSHFGKQSIACLKSSVLFGLTHSFRYSNRREYASLVANVRLRESAQQCEAIRRGLLAVFPFGGLLSLFTWQQFETLVTGAQDIDIELLKVHFLFF